jgi:hypothetical protein
MLFSKIFLANIMFFTSISSIPIPKKAQEQELRKKTLDDFIIDNHRIHQVDIKIEYEPIKVEKKAEKLEKAEKPEKTEKLN